MVPVIEYLNRPILARKPAKDPLKSTALTGWSF